MKYLLILTPLLFLFTTSIVNATDYYYCDCQAGASSQCVAGKKTNNGTSASSPRQTFANANSTFNNLNPGESIKFCRGGSFSTTAKYRWVNNKCSASKKCSVTAYDMPGQESSQLARPIITQKSNNTLFTLSDAGNADHDEGYIFSDLDIRCTACKDGFGFYLYNDVDYVTLENISIDAFRIGVYIAKSNAVNPGSDGTQDFITINNLTIINNKAQGFLGGANNLIISNSKFENNGGGNKFDHNMYISSGDNIKITRNDLYRSSVDINNSCAGTPLVVHGKINNMLIENNTIREDVGKAEPGCWGISVSPAYSAPESFTNVIIRGNKVINVGNIGIGLASCDTCLVENNVILQQQSFPFTAISAPNRSRDSNDQSLNKVTIRNNSIYTKSPGTAIKLGTEGREHIVVSNAIHYTGSGKFTCFNVGLTASAYKAVDNNTCYFPNALSTSRWEAGTGVNPSPLTAWQAKSSFGVNSQQNVDPEFKDPSLPVVNLSPRSEYSPMSNAGHRTYSAQKDFRGKNRDIRPDMGAYEFGTFNPPSKTTVYFD